eukprot:6197899-Pleurochrysis_carterae.AAC.1
MASAHWSAAISSRQIGRGSTSRCISRRTCARRRRAFRQKCAARSRRARRAPRAELPERGRAVEGKSHHVHHGGKANLLHQPSSRTLRHRPSNVCELDDLLTSVFSSCSSFECVECVGSPCAAMYTPREHSPSTYTRLV